MKRAINVAVSLAVFFASTAAFACSDPNCKDCADDAAKTQTAAPQQPGPAPAPAPTPTADPH